MTDRPLNLALIWHMHQPYYKDLVTDEYILPWVRLHAVKDYYTMVAILEKFPEVKMTFNLVPSLLLQIEDYAQNEVVDKFLTVSVKDAEALTLEERVFLLQNFFMANWENMINPYPRYRDLLLKRGRFVSPAELPKVAKRFSIPEILDLQVWFNLTWFGFIEKAEDPVISELIKKGKYFTPEEKRLVIQKQFEIIRKVIPKHREALERGQIEITTTPFYHPILPLLCDSSAAREALPHLALPKQPFQHPEDAQKQIQMAVEFHQQHFGQKPLGMWPSEGSVSESIIPLLAGAGIKWMATDEGILERSLRSRGLSAEELYQPYLAEKDGSALTVVFRNHFISDQVGFVYYRWKIKEAIDDFNHHLHNICVSLPSGRRDHLVSVILDGENAWEYYPGGGREFLEAFYHNLRHQSAARTVRVSDYLNDHPPQRKLSKLFPGSWIDSNFKIWIGHEEDNLAWDYLHQARNAVEKSDDPKVWQEVYIAEGSDWNWWYGDDHSSDNDAAFDALFRKHLKNVYLLAGLKPPQYLDYPIKKAGAIKPLREPVFLVHPVLDGEISNYYEWLPAGLYDISRARGSMHQTETVIREIHYGFDLANLYLLLKVNFDLSADEAKSFSFAFVTFAPKEYKGEIVFDFENKKHSFGLFRLNAGHSWDEVKRLDSFGVKQIIELGVPFADLEVQPDQNLEFVVVIYKDGQEVERWPRGGTIAITAPTQDYELQQWYV